MKLLHREDVEEAGYDMPVTGLCANISEFDLEALKFAGEWILADDENLVGDGQRQHQSRSRYVDRTERVRLIGTRPRRPSELQVQEPGGIR